MASPWDDRGMHEDLSDLNRATYDRIAPLYAQNQADGVRREGNDGRWYGQLEARFLTGLPNGALIADLGCGPGGDAARFAEAGFHVVGIDLSHGMLELARPALNGWAGQGKLQALPLRDRCVDAIWCSAALLHVPEQATTTVLREFHRVLRPSGRLALVTAVGEGESLEPVPYAPDEQRWFVYREAARLRDQLVGAGYRLLFEDTQTSHREWLCLLAVAEKGSPARTRVSGWAENLAVH